MKIRPQTINAIKPRLYWLFYVWLIASACSGITTHAGLPNAVAWLAQAQTQNGALTNESLMDITPLQARGEVATALLTQAQSNTLNVDDILASEQSTEALVRAILILHSQSKPTQPLVTTLLKAQNSDGGFGFVPGWQSNALDTAWALIALHTVAPSSLTASEQRALQYLKPTQKPDGSYQVVSLERLYVSGYVLTAITPLIALDNTLAPIAQRIATYIQSQQTSPATWAVGSDNETGLFLDALLTDVLYDYITVAEGQQLAQAFSQKVTRLQKANGSWANDAYLTALVVKALHEVSSPVSSPLLADVEFSVRDSETNQLLAGVKAISTGGSASAINAASNAQGLVALSRLAKGYYLLTLSLPGYNDLTVDFNTSHGQRLSFKDLQLQRAANTNATQITGQILDSSTGYPIGGASVQAGDVSTITDNQGKYLLAVAQQGPVTVTVSAPNYVEQTLSANAQGGAVVVNTKLYTQEKNVATVLGRVVDTSGNPLADMLLNFGDYAYATGGNGKFIMFNSPAGQQTLSIDSEWGTHQSSQISMYIQAGKVIDLGTITLLSNSQPALTTGTIALAVLDSASNQPLVGASATAQRLDASGNVLQTIPINPNSTEPATLPVGDWLLTFTANGYQPSNLSVTIGNTPQSRSLALALQPYSLSATVLDATNSNPLTSTPYRVLSASGTVLASGTTDSNGYLSVANLTSTPVTLSIKPTAHLAQQFTYGLGNLQDGSINAGELRLRPLSADVKLPDIQLSKIDITATSTNQQSLVSTGTVTVEFANNGTAPLWQAKPIGLQAFYDRNRNHQLDGSDVLLGSTSLSTDLKLRKANSTTIAIAGQALYRDEPISIWVDDNQAIVEQNEANNIKSSADLLLKAQPGVIDPVVKYRWTMEGSQAFYGITVSNAVVSPIKDTNGDNKIGSGDKAVVWLHDRDFGMRGVCCNTIKAVDFSTSTPQVVYRAYTPSLNGIFIAVADFVQNGTPYIATHSSQFNTSGSWTGRDLYSIFDGLGQLVHRVTTGQYTHSNFRIVDINHDNNASIFSTSHFDNPSALEYSNLANSNATALAHSIQTAPVTRDNINWLAYTNLLWQDTRQHQSAVIDWFGTGNPQILSRQNTIMAGSGYNLWSMDGKSILKSITNTGYASGNSAFVIDDLNQDNAPDLAFINEDGIYLYANDGSLVASNTSIFNGITFKFDFNFTTFDLNGDGTKEFIVTYDRHLSILDGKTLNINQTITFDTWVNRSTPKVADIDADGSADIVVLTFNGANVVSSASKSWSNTRNIWNQELYNISNINDDLTVPKYDRPWETHNSFGVQVNYGKAGVPVADATASYIRIQDAGTSSTPNAQFSVRVGSSGALQLAAGVPVSYYRVAPNSPTGSTGQLLGTVTTTNTLVAGEYEDVTINYAASLADFGSLRVVVNDAGNSSHTPVPEFTADNNVAELDVASGAAKLTLATALNQPAFGLDEQLTLTATPSNFGSFAVGTTLQFSIYDSTNTLVAQLPQQTLSVAPSGSANVEANWQVTGPAGTYTVVTKLFAGNGTSALATDTQPFSIKVDAPGGATTATSLYTNKQLYNTSDAVALNVDIRNASRNSIATNVVSTTNVYNPAGQLVWTTSKTYPRLSIGLQQTQSQQIPLTQASVGTYTVRTTTQADGQPAYSVERTFAVQSSLQTGSGLTGKITPPGEVLLGSSVNFATQVDYKGNEGLNGLPTRLILINPNSTASDQLVSTIGTASLQLDSTGSYKHNYGWQVAGQLNQPYIAVLQVQLRQANGSAGDWFTLDKQVLGITEPTTTLTVSSDKPSYSINQSATITLTATNSSSVALSNAQSTLRIYAPDGSLFSEQTANHATWAAGTTIKPSYTVALGRAAAGSWRVAATTNTAAGVLLQRSEATFAVESSLVTGVGLSGSVMANPATVQVQQPLNLSYSVANAGNANWDNLPITVTVYRGNAVAYRFNSTIAGLAIDGTSTGATSWLVDGNGNENLRVELSATVNGAPKVLGSAQVYVQPRTTLEVGIGNGNGAAANNVLVYYSCKPGWFGHHSNFKSGTYKHSCFGELHNTLNQYFGWLKATNGINYTISYKPNSFKTAMRSGQYNQYWVLGAVEKFNHSSNDELREHSYGGSSVVFDSGIKGWGNWELYDLVDVKHHGVLPLKAPSFNPSQPIYQPNATLGSPTSDDMPDKLSLGKRAVQSATYATHHGAKPAIVTAPFGKGKPTALAFDLPDSLTIANNNNKNAQWQEWLEQTVNYSLAAPRSQYAPSEEVKLPLTIGNKQPAATTAKVVVDLPAGSKWLGLVGSPAAPVVQGNQVTFTASIGSNATLSTSMRLQLPNTAGTAAVRVRVYDATNSLLADSEQRYTQVSTATRLDLVGAQLHKLNIWSIDAFGIAIIKTKFKLAKAAYALGLYDNAIAALAEMGEHMALMQQNTQPTRAELSELIRNISIEWYSKLPADQKAL